jgi:hypothetical protein
MQAPVMQAPVMQAPAIQALAASTPMPGPCLRRRGAAKPRASSEDAP